MPKDNEGEQAEKAKPQEEKKLSVEKKAEAPSLEGLVKMKRGDRVIHAHPSTIKNHKENGWKEV